MRPNRHELHSPSHPVETTTQADPDNTLDGGIQSSSSTVSDARTAKRSGLLRIRDAAGGKVAFRTAMREAMGHVITLLGQSVAIDRRYVDDPAGHLDEIENLAESWYRDQHAPREAAELVPGLRCVLRDKAKETEKRREQAAKILFYLGPYSQEAREDLETALRHDRSRIRRYAALALWQMGKAAKLSLRTLETAARRPKEDCLVRAYAAAAIIELTGETNFLQVIFDAREHRDWAEQEIIVRIVDLLGSLGPTVSSAKPFLLELQDEDTIRRFLQPAIEADPRRTFAQERDKIRSHAERALDRIGCGQALPTLLRDLDREETRLEAIQILAQIGPAAGEEVLERLLRIVMSEDATFRLDASIAIARIAPDNRPAIERLLAFLTEITSRATIAEHLTPGGSGGTISSVPAPSLPTPTASNDSPNEDPTRPSQPNGNDTVTTPAAESQETQTRRKDDLDRAAEAYVSGRPFLELLNSHLHSVSQQIFETLEPAKAEVQRVVRFVRFANAQLLLGETPVTFRCNSAPRSKRPSFQARTRMPTGYIPVYIGKKFPPLRAILR